MRILPLPRAALATLLLAACGCEEPSTDEPTDADRANEVESVPFAGPALEPGSVSLVTDDGDTLSLATAETGDGLLLSTVRRPAGGPTDSLAAVVDPNSLEPVSSFQRRFIGADSVIARVVYGSGFEGQARLTLETPGGSGSENLRTPSPVLDEAQIPHSLAALELGVVDTISFNYVAPFERETIAARFVLAGLDTLRIEGGDVPAWPVVLRVGGLEERFWFAAADRDLLRIEETTRGVTWNRPAAR